MADISLRIKSDFEQAQRDFAQLAGGSENLRAKIEKLQKEFSAQHVDKFMEKNRLAATAVRATGGATAALTAESRGLQREMTRLIKSGLDPQNEHLQRMRSRFVSVQSEMDRTANKGNVLTRVFGSMGSMLGALSLGYAVRELARLANHFINAASDAEELQNKFETVFAGVTDETEKWVDTYSVAVARGGYATKEFLTTLQDIRTGFGDTNANAAEFSKAVVGVTNDLSSFSNVKFEEASAAIQSGLSGQFEALRRLGVGLNVNIINQGQYAKSIGKTWLTMSNLEKQEAILTGVMQQSKNALHQNISAWTDYDYALGDAAITSKSYSNQAQLTDGLLKDVSATIGKNALPAATNFRIELNKGLASFNAWAKEGTNLSDAMESTFYVVTQLARAVTGLGVSFSSMPFAFHDAAASIKIALLDVGATIANSVTNRIGELLALISRIPGASNQWKVAADSVKVYGVQLKMAVAMEQMRQIQNRKMHADMTKSAQDAAAVNSKLSAQKLVADAAEMGSNEKKMKSFKSTLEAYYALDQNTNLKRIEEATKFFEQRAALESEDGAARIEWLREQYSTIWAMHNLSVEQRLEAEQGLNRAITAEDRKLTAARVQFGAQMLSTASDMVADLQTVFRNAGAESRGLALLFKGLAIAQATISSYTAFAAVLENKYLAALYPANMIAAGLTLAAGLAKVAAIATTPIPSAETGISNYTVPDIRSNQRDGAAVMASAGESVTVSPRGEEAGLTQQINMQIGEDVIFRVVRKGIATGKIDISNRNIGKGVFAL
jgi:hypothetical protein